MAKKIRPDRIAKGVAKATKSLISGSSKFTKDRLLECQKPCEHLSNGICVLCNCVVKAKSEVFEEYCPANIWKDIKILEKAGLALAIKNPDLATISVNEETNRFTLDYGKYKWKTKDENGKEVDTDTNLKLVVVNDRGNFFTENQDLTEIKLAASCSCTISSKPKKTLKEGDYLEFDIKYEARKAGVFSKKAHFLAKETAFFITLKGEVI